MESQEKVKRVAFYVGQKQVPDSMDYFKAKYENVLKELFPELIFEKEFFCDIHYGKMTSQREGYIALREKTVSNGIDFLVTGTMYMISDSKCQFYKMLEECRQHQVQVILAEHNLVIDEECFEVLGKDVKEIRKCYQHILEG